MTYMQRSLYSIWDFHVVQLSCSRILYTGPGGAVPSKTTWLPMVSAEGRGTEYTGRSKIPPVARLRIESYLSLYMGMQYVPINNEAHTIC